VPVESTSGVETVAEWYKSVVEHNQASVPNASADDHWPGPARSMLLHCLSAPTLLVTRKDGVIDALVQQDATTSGPATIRMLA
jgi:hypothetical protein